MSQGFHIKPVGESPFLHGLSRALRGILTPNSLARQESLSMLRGNLSRFTQTISWPTAAVSPNELRDNILEKLNSFEAQILEVAQTGLKQIFGYDHGLYLFNLNSGFLFNPERSGLKPGTYDKLEGKKPLGDDKEDMILKILDQREINPLHERVFEGDAWKCLYISNRRALRLPNVGDDLRAYKSVKPEVLDEICYFFPKDQNRNFTDDLEYQVFQISGWSRNKRICRGIPATLPEDMIEIGNFVSEIMHLLNGIRKDAKLALSKNAILTTQNREISVISEISRLPVGIIWEPAMGDASKYFMKVIPLKNNETAFYLLSASARDFAKSTVALCKGEQVELSLIYSRSIPEILANLQATKNLDTNFGLFLGVINEESGILRYGTNGFFPNGNILFIPSEGPCDILYNFSGSHAVAEERFLQLKPGDAIFVYGSGLPSTVSPPKKGVNPFGHDGIRNSINMASVRTPQGIAQRVADALAEHAGGMTQSYSKAALAIGAPQEIFKKVWRIMNAEKMLAAGKTDYALVLKRLAIENLCICPDSSLSARVSNALMTAVEMAGNGDLAPAEMASIIDGEFEKIKMSIEARSVSVRTIHDNLRKLEVDKLSCNFFGLLNLQEVDNLAQQILSREDYGRLKGQIAAIASSVAEEVYDGIWQKKTKAVIFAGLNNIFSRQVEILCQSLRSLWDRYRSQSVKLEELEGNLLSRINDSAQIDFSSLFKTDYDSALSFVRSSRKKPKKFAAAIVDGNRDAAKSVLDRIFHIEIKDSILSQMIRFGYTSPLTVSDFSQFGDKAPLIWRSLINTKNISTAGVIQPGYTGDLTMTGSTIGLNSKELRDVTNIMEEHLGPSSDMRAALEEAIGNKIVYGAHSENSQIKCEIGRTEKDILCSDGQVVPKGTERAVIEVYSEAPDSAAQITDHTKLGIIDRTADVRGRGTAMMRILTSKDTTIDVGTTPNGKSTYYRIRIVKYKDPDLRQLSDEERLEITMGSLSGLEDFFITEKKSGPDQSNPKH